MSTNYINKITDTAGTIHDIMEGVDTRIFRATCSTAAATAAKVATLEDSTNYSLVAGVKVAVTFTYGNSAATPTLNVNSSGAKTIATATAVATLTTGNGTTYNTWGPYETVIFTYNGTYWVKGGTGYSAANAYILANSKTSNTGTITKVTTAAGTHTTVDVSSGSVSFNVPTKTSHLTNDSGFITSDSDTKNTAGSTDTSSKIFLIGATSQAENPQTYSHDTAYVGTDGKLYSASKVVLVGGLNASSSVTITPSTTDVYSMTSAGSVTAGTANVPTVIDTSKFSGGSFTRGSFSGGSFTSGTFSQGTLPTLTFEVDATDTKKLNITFSQGTLPSHGADSFTAATHAADTFTAAKLNSGFYTAGTAGTPTSVTLPGRSSAIKAWTGYTDATAAAQTFTGSSS